VEKMFNRNLLMSSIENFKLPENVELVSEDNWPEFQIKEKSVIARFETRYGVTRIEFFVWGSFQEINKGFIPGELSRACFAMMENFKAAKAWELESLKKLFTPISEIDIDQAYSEFVNNLPGWAAA